MNLLLLNEQQLLSPSSALVRGRQFQHAIQTLKCREGDEIKVGVINGQKGRACITRLDTDHMALDIHWTESAPPAIPCTLYLALPRPKMLKRILQTCATMGVKQIYLINAWKVEKSFWQSPWLSPEKVTENFLLGLEQAGDTVMPTLHMRRLFKPFVEDELPGLIGSQTALLAHPGAGKPCPVAYNQTCHVAIGPEGGFTPYEVTKLKAAGFEGVDLGERILRVETAVTSVLARLFCN